MNVGNIVTSTLGIPATTGPGSVGTPSHVNFSDVLGGAISQVEASQEKANTAAMDLLANGKGDVHSVALATQRAELSLELFQQVKNKFVQAYQEIMKMPM
jgi:flagellar hook-basal body complex protein FliE